MIRLVVGALLWVAIPFATTAALFACAGASGGDLSATTVFYVVSVHGLVWLLPLFVCAGVARRDRRSLSLIVIAYPCGLAAWAIPAVGGLVSLMVLVATCHWIVRPPPPLRTSPSAVR